MLLQNRLLLGSRWWKVLRNRKARRNQPAAKRHWRIEELEVRTVMSAVTGTPVESGWDAAVAARVQKLKATQFKQLQANDVKYLTSAQLQSITTPKTLASLSNDARAALSAEQIQQLNVSKSGIAGLTPLQIESLTVTQIQLLKVADFKFLLAEQVPLLTGKQVATINSDKLLRSLPVANRAALTGEQLKQMKLTAVGISLLTDSQLEALTVPQIQSLKTAKDLAQLLPTQTKSLTSAQWTTLVGAANNSAVPDDKQVGDKTVGQIRALQSWQFNQLTAEQVPYLTVQQISATSGSWSFDRMPDAARAALTPGQVRALMVGSTGIKFLSESQKGSLSTAQIQALSYWSLRDLLPSQIPQLSMDQLAAVPNDWWFRQIPEAGRALLTADQVKALNVAELGLDELTTAQIGQLSTAQIQSLKYWDFGRLTAAQTPQLTANQIASIPNEWWFGRMSAEARAALKPAQVQALNVREVRLKLLTKAQIDNLTTAQVQSVEYSQFGMLTAKQTPWLTTEQIASIPNGWWFERMLPQARAALTAGQMQSLDVGNVGLGGLTKTQVSQLIPEQVRQVDQYNFRYLPATHTPQLTTEQLATIDSEWWFLQIAADARAVLSGDQVRALDIHEVGLKGLTAAQIDELTPEQIQSVEYWYFQYLTPKQAPHLSTEQLASIDSEWWFKQIPEAARAALTAEQIQALHVDLVGLSGLTDSQIDALSAEQIQDANYWDFDELHAEQIDDLSTTQIASIPNCWWFEQIPEDVRSHLTVEQIQSIDTANVTIDHLMASQRLNLTVEQIQDIDDGWYFQFLTPEQVTLLTTEQMTLIDSGWEFNRMSDEARAALTREQLLAVPNEVHAQLLHLDSHMFAPEHTAEVHGEDGHTHETPAPPPTTGPHTDDPAKREEHLALFALVPREAATFVSIASGNWNDPATWQGGAVPTGAAQVLVSAGTTVTFNQVQTNAMKWVRVDGELDFATNIDTQMLVETIIVDPAGTLHIGTAANPVASGVAARLVIADGGQAIDKTWDPFQLSRGLISHGAVEMQGEDVTPFVSLNVAPRKNDTVLRLDSVPTNWRVGDRLVLTGTTTDIKAKQDEELSIVAIDGNLVTIDADDDVAGVQGLKFNHTPPEGFGLKVYVADMNRNVVVMSQNPYINDRRGHVMFMHSPKVNVHNVGFYGLGRTDKRNPLNDAVFDEDGTLLETTGLNQRGRYAVHFHRSGTDATKTPALIQGSVVVDSPGWGFVNHDSNVDMLDNVAFNVQGASFVTEFGSEIGTMARNLSIRNEGSGDGLESRQDIFDFGHGGDGFWLQGPGVKVVDNIAASAAEAAFIFFTASSEAEFSAANLDDPSLAAGRTSVPVGTVPFKQVSGNTGFASGSGLETWFHLTHMNDGQSYIDGMTTWNTNRGIFNPYTGRTTIRDALVVGRTGGGWVWGTGIDRNNVTNNMTYENVRVEGWEVGISVPVNRATVINDGTFRNVRDIEIDTAHDTIRTVDINGDPQFLPLSANQLGGRSKFEIYLDGHIDVKNRDIETYFSPDIVRLGTVRFNDHQVYYFKQAADYVPFPASDTETLTWLPPEIVGKTNQQLWDEFGIAPGGVIAPADAVPVDGINGLVGSRSTYLPELELRSAKYTNQVNDYHLSYVDPVGDVVHEDNTTPLREGWNLLTRQIDGETRTFFVYGDTKAPEFILNTQRTDLRVNPKGLQFGIVIYGTVRDDSFGEMSFRREFKNLQTLPKKTDANGKQYLELTFSIRDLAGNETSITLKVMLDPNAPIVPGTQQRDLPPRDIPRTLTELLEYYFLTGEAL